MSSLAMYHTYLQQNQSLIIVSFFTSASQVILDMATALLIAIEIKQIPSTDQKRNSNIVNRSQEWTISCEF